MAGGDPEYRFEVSFSFAGGKRDIIRQIAELVRAEVGDQRVFFDEWFIEELSGFDAHLVLQRVYRHETRVVVVCVCEQYARKPWVQEEWRAIQELERGLRDGGEENRRRMRLLLLRFGDGNLDGLYDTALVPDVRAWTQRAIADLVLKRLRRARGEAEPSSRDNAEHAPASRPETSEVFVGRDDELAAIEHAFAATPGARVAVVAVQGMAGVGKTFLVEEFCARHPESFGVICRWVLDPTRPESAQDGLLTIAEQVGIDRDRTPLAEIPKLIAKQRILVHIDNVDGAEAAKAAVALLARLPESPAIVTGRYTSLGTSPTARWTRVEIECLSAETSTDLLRRELGDRAPSEQDLRALVDQVGGLPLALHLAAGYLRNDFAVAEFLERLRSSNLLLESIDEADPLSQSRSRGIVGLSFQVSRELFLAEAARRGQDWEMPLASLGWAARTGFGRELGAAITGVSPEAFIDLIYVATSLSLVRRVPRAPRPDGAWSVHPLVAEFLRAGVPREAVDARIATWVATLADRADDGARDKRWTALSRENAGVHAWLATVPDATLASVIPPSWLFIESQGPVGPWLAAARSACSRMTSGRASLAWVWANLATRVGASDEVTRAICILEEDGDGHRDTAKAMGLRADILQQRGEIDEALRIRREKVLPIYERLDDARGIAVTMGRIADILQSRGELDEALRIRREEQLPIFERRGDGRAIAVAMGQIANILESRGEFEEALRIRRDQVLPVYERIGDLRSRAVTMGQIADILGARGELDEALRIRREEQLPVYERLGDVREIALTKGKVADILSVRGELDEALRIRREEQLPVYERLGDIRLKAMTMGRIADILRARGEMDEALRIWRYEQLPTYERWGGRDLAVGLAKTGLLLIARGSPTDLVEARAMIERSATMSRTMKIPFPDFLEAWLASDAGRGST